MPESRPMTWDELVEELKKERQNSKRLKDVILYVAEVGTIACPDQYGFEVLDWPGKMCINSDCRKCWKWSIEHAEEGGRDND